MGCQTGSQSNHFQQERHQFFSGMRQTDTATLCTIGKLCCLLPFSSEILGVPRVTMGMIPPSCHAQDHLSSTHKIARILQMQLGRKMKGMSLECAYYLSRPGQGNSLIPLLDISTCMSPMPWRKGLLFFTKRNASDNIAWVWDIMYKGGCFIVYNLQILI